MQHTGREVENAGEKMLTKLGRSSSVSRLFVKGSVHRKRVHCRKVSWRKGEGWSFRLMGQRSEKKIELHRKMLMS